MIFFSTLAKKRLSFLFVVVLLFPKISFSQIQIDSIKTTVSTCPNNGTITVYAKGSASLFYSIIAGPVTEPTQTNNLFSSLPAGSYTVQVSDGGVHVITKDTTITGNYIPLDFSPITISPYCIGNSNGQIIGNRTAGTGNGPFTWKLIAPSPTTTLLQPSDTFNNLAAGNYTVRLTDGCGSFRTIVATVSNPNVGFGFAAPIYMDETGCDSSLLDIAIKVPPDGLRLPFTYKYVTKNGIYIPPAGSTKIDSAGGTQPKSTIYITQLIPGITYGDSIEATIYDACGDSIYTLQQSYPYQFYFEFGYNNCGTSVSGGFSYIPPQQADLFGLKTPVTYSLVNTATNVVVQTSSITGGPNPGDYYGNIVNYLPITDSLPIGETYTLNVKDGCGKIFTQNYTVPSLAPPAIVGKDILYSPCIDSVMGLYRIHIQGFGENPKIILFSGPSTLGSTKPKFPYTDTYTYPDTLGAGEYIFLDNLNVGTYQYKIIDDCGNAIFDSIIVTPANIISLNYSDSYKKGCLGENKIYYTLSHSNDLGYIPVTSNTVVVTNLSTGAVLKNQQSYNGVYNDSVLNVPSGKYEITFEFQLPGYGTSINNIYTGCWTIKDTITIPGYQTPQITSGNSILCHNTIHMELLPDSSKGVPPYQYEIINGPQTFPVQISNLFSLTQAGTYTARIFDTCGNASTAQVTVAGTTFPPINRIATDCNSTKLFYGSSIYYTYKWTKPNGSIYTGDTLAISPVTPADTGIYSIQRIVNIGGCTDTAYTSYHLSLIATHLQTIQFCAGIVVHVGTSTYNTPGIYTDTLKNVNSLGCDSVVITTLTAMQKKDTNNVTICKGSSITIGSNVYSTSGLYKDSVLNTAGCYDLKFTNLTVNQLKDTVNAAICSLGSITVGTHVYNTAGTYIDTLQSAQTGCDSIVVLNLSINPLDIFVIDDTVSEVVCQGDSLDFGTTLYTQSGIYQDTIVQGCSGIVITVNVTVNPYKRDTVVKSICAGDNFVFNGNGYTKTGFYSDTLSTLTCDSIVTLNLSVDNSCGTPLRLCSGATHIVWKDDFGSGVPINGGPSPNINPAYIDQNNGVVSGNYSILNYFNYQTCCWHKVTEDHTPNDTDGYFLVIDGGVPDFYSTRINNLCPNTDYTFSVWTMNMDLPTYPSLPTFIFNVTDTLNNAIGQLATPPMPVAATPTWVNNGFTFNSGNNTSLKLSLILTSVGYNDFAFDDLALSVCGPTLSLTPAVATCNNKVTVTATLGSGYANPVYQWYKLSSGNWASITNATATTYTDNNPAQNNWYKLTVKDGASSCSYIEDSVQVTLSNAILPAVTIDSTICSGQSAYGYTTAGTYIDTLIGVNGCDSIQRTLTLTVNNCIHSTCDTSLWKARTTSTADGDGINCTGPWLNASQFIANGIAHVPPAFACYPYYWSDFHLQDTMCITNNFTYEIRLRDPASEGGIDSYDIGITLQGSGISTGCQLEGGNGIKGPVWAQQWTSAYAGTNKITNNPALVMNFDDWHTITLTYKDNVLYYGKDDTTFFQLPYSGNICNIESLDVGFKGSGDIDWMRILDANNNEVWREDFDSCQSLKPFPPCSTIAPVVTASYTTPTCTDDTLRLFSTADQLVSFNWTGPNGFTSTEQNPTIPNPTVNANGMYTVTARVNNCASTQVSKSINVSFTPVADLKSFLTIDTTICQGQNYLGYNATGKYVDTFINVKGCDSIRTLNLFINPVSSKTIDASICQGQTYMGYNTSGNYINTFTNAKGCDSVVTIKLTVNNNPTATISASATEVNSGGIVHLNTTPSLSYLWTSAATINNNTIQNPTATIYNSSWIYLVATDNVTDCQSVDSVFILVHTNTHTSPCNDEYITMPNAFTPNGDGVNDVFKINSKEITLKQFQIFNRWGEMVFETTNLNQSWDGTYKGETTAGNYVYWISYYSSCYGKVEMLKGNVVLIK